MTLNQGVEYFPLNVHMDDKMKFIEVKFGLEGFAIVIKLLQHIYSNGYWCKWTEDEILLFSHGKCEAARIKEITDECIFRGIFDSHVFEQYGILTSKGIQKRYAAIVRRRKDVEIINEYWLIDSKNDKNAVNMSSTCRQHVVKNEKIVPKGKESKGKESKVNNNDTQSPFLHYENNIGLLSPVISDSIGHYQKDGIEDALICKAIDIACEQNVRKWKYCDSILNQCLKNNIFNLTQFEIKENEYRNKGHPKQEWQKFNQREYSDAMFKNFFSNQE